MKQIKILLIVIIALVYYNNISAQIIPEWATTYDGLFYFVTSFR